MEHGQEPGDGLGADPPSLHHPVRFAVLDLPSHLLMEGHGNRKGRSSGRPFLLRRILALRAIQQHIQLARFNLCQRTFSLGPPMLGAVGGSRLLLGRARHPFARLAKIDDLAQAAAPSAACAASKPTKT